MSNQSIELAGQQAAQKGLLPAFLKVEGTMEATNGSSVSIVPG